MAKVSAAQKAIKDPKYLPWLHDLTEYGYSQGVMIESRFAETVAFLFLCDKSPEEALPEYLEVKRRYDAIKNHYRQ